MAIFRLIRVMGNTIRSIINDYPFTFFPTNKVRACPVKCGVYFTGVGLWSINIGDSYHENLSEMYPSGNVSGNKIR